MVAAVIAIWFFFYNKPVSAPVSTPDDITQEIDNIDLGNLDNEFQEIDQGLNQL